MRVIVSYMVHAVAARTDVRAVREGVGRWCVVHGDSIARMLVAYMVYKAAIVSCTTAAAAHALAIPCCFASLVPVSDIRTMSCAVWPCRAEAPRPRVPVRTGHSPPEIAVRTRPRARARSPCCALAPSGTPLLVPASHHCITKEGQLLII